MWKVSSARVSARLQCEKCRRFFNSSKQLNEAAAKPAVKPSAPPPPPPPPPVDPPKGGGIFWKLLGVTTLTTGGVVGYAWYDQSFRKTLEENVPYSKDVFETIFPYLPDPGSFRSDDANTSPKQQTPKQVEPLLPVQKPFTPSSPPPATPTKEVVSQKPETEKERLKRETEKRLKEKEAEEAAMNTALEVMLESLSENGKETTRKAVDVLHQVVETTKSHTQLLKKAMDDKTEILQKDEQWEDVAGAFVNREKAVKESQNITESARLNLEKLRAAIDEGKREKVTKKNKALIAAQETLNKQTAELNQASAQVTKTQSEAKAMSHYKDLVEKGRKQFQKELESIMPDVKLGDKKGKKLSEDELNSLIAHAHRRIEQLQKQLAEQLALEGQHIEKALTQQAKENEKLTGVRVGMEADRLMSDFELEKEKWAADARLEFEQELRQQLSRQAAAHSDHLKDVLNVQQGELEQQFERVMHTRLLEERQNFQTEVAGWIARLKGIEAAVDNRAEAEKIARTAQELWLACIALNGFIRLGREEGLTWEDKLKPLNDEVVAISEASGRHPFVETVIRTIPEEALERGVWTEESLKERFSRVKKMCKRVAMIDETGGSLLKYFLSYLQSFFIFETVQAKTLEHEIDLGDFDAFAILSHASYWIEKGDFEQALRFLNQLKGEPRRVASDWVQEARLLCETRQAAYALIAFASASGLGTLF